ncbi:AAA family ATPase [Schaalia georgiae]|uniref:AAA family ATPase n=1 Tax=Schaalia georgiae TaxID=52768 RepID=UPI00041447F4|nr:MoxR family ATPase [Schaalia georgiae]
MTNPLPPSSDAPYGPPRTDAAPAGEPQGQAWGGGTPPAAPGAPSAPSSFSAPSEEQTNGRALSPQEERTKDALMALRSEIGKAVVGQEGAVTGLIIALVAGGHALLEGVPGVAKTLLVRTMATALDVDMARIQFTPDLMPADITGSLVWDAGSSAFDFRRGPVFTNLLLADEINRTPPKTQSALLEAMEERQVSVDGQTHALADPFMVIATQNPVEYEGTYPLPEAQLDRFLLKLELPLPGRDAEFGIVKRHRDGFNPLALADAGVRPVASPADIAAARGAAARVDVSDTVLAYLVDVCRATRESPSVRLGASPRGATALLRTTRVWAFLQGRGFATPDDVKAMAAPTLAHRIGLRAEADLEGLTATRVVEGVLAQVPVPR